MARKKFRLSARISSDKPSAVEPILEHVALNEVEHANDRMLWALFLGEVSAEYLLEVRAIQFL